MSERVRERIAILGLPHGELAGRVSHVSGGRWTPDRQAIVMIVRGTRTVTDVELIALASALETTVAWMVGEAN